MGVRYRLHRDYGWAAGLFLIIGALAFCPVREWQTYGALLCVTCGTFLISNVDVAIKPVANVFYAGICLGLASLVNPWLLLLVPCAFFHLAGREQMLNRRTFWAMLLGIATVMIYVIAVLLWKNPMVFEDAKIDGFIEVFSTFPTPENNSSWRWFKPVCMVIFLFRAISFYHEVYPDEKTHTRQFMFLMETLTFGLCVLWFIDKCGWGNFNCNTLILIPLSAFATHYFLRMKGKWLKYRRLFWLALFMTSIFV